MDFSLYTSEQKWFKYEFHLYVNILENKRELYLQTVDYIHIKALQQNSEAVSNNMREWRGVPKGTYCEWPHHQILTTWTTRDCSVLFVEEQ